MKANRTPLEKLSKLVFNSEHRLTIVEALRDADGLTTTAAIVKSTGIAYSTVHDELNLMAELGVLQRVIPERQVLFQRLSGPFWDWCSVLAASVGAEEVSQGS
jgi:hypothetical protein